MNQLDYQTNIQEGKGAPMLICAVDTASGELKEMRVISLGHLQSEHLHQHCRELDQKRPMNPSTYNMMVDRIYQQYPSSDLMARLIRRRHHHDTLRAEKTNIIADTLRGSSITLKRQKAATAGIAEQS